MAYAPLFHEIHSELFLALCRMVNAIYQGGQLSRQEMLRRLPPMDWQGQQRAEQLLDNIFAFGSDGMAKLFLSAPVPYRASQNELIWLKTMLQDEKASFLLSNTLREKLLKRLQDVPKLNWASFWQVIQERGDVAVDIQEKLATIWRALQEHKQLQYSNYDRQGRLHQGVCLPCRLEYDAAGNRFHLIAWKGDEQRAFKMKLVNLQQVKCLKADIPADTEDAFQKFLKEKQRSVTLRIARKNNAVERCFMLFAPYDKEAVYDEDNDSYTMKVYYYDFDRQEVLQQIISLGAAATVLEPQDIREKMVERLQKAWAFIQQGQAPLP